MLIFSYYGKNKKLLDSFMIFINSINHSIHNIIIFEEIYKNELSCMKGKKKIISIIFV